VNGSIASHADLPHEMEASSSEGSSQKTSAPIQAAPLRPENAVASSATAVNAPAMPAARTPTGGSPCARTDAGGSTSPIAMNTRASNASDGVEGPCGAKPPGDWDEHADEQAISSGTTQPIPFARTNCVHAHVAWISTRCQAPPLGNGCRKGRKSEPDTGKSPIDKEDLPRRQMRAMTKDFRHSRDPPGVF